MRTNTTKRSEPVSSRPRSSAPRSGVARTARSDTGEAFFPDPTERRTSILTDDADPESGQELGEEMAEEYVRAVTSGRAAYASDPAATPDEIGDPFGSDEPLEEDEEPVTLRQGRGVA